MCGIAGIAGPHDFEWVRRMNSTLSHRGPDDHGYYQTPDGLVSLAMRRLSIIDLQHGHQPMHNEDGTIWIVFNGEIYNAPDIRPGLETRGHHFATENSDTEVLLHLYEEMGVQLVERLNGMFAFVIHDQRNNLLFGARDRMGIKPLYYSSQSPRFAFASELKGLLTLPFIQRDVDHQSLYHYMSLLYVPGSDSIIRNVNRVPPGHYFVYDVRNRHLTVKRYWCPSFRAVEHHTEDEWAHLLRLELRSAVQRWTLSDVPIACSLSGGLDSSAIVGLLGELGYPKIKTYSLGFVGEREESWNELDLARQVAKRWGTEHHEIFLEPRELLRDLVDMVWHLDEPYGGGLPPWYVFQEMSKDVKVGLTGIGGDELFGNYGKFRVYETNQLVRAVLAWRRWAGWSADGLAQVISPVAELTDRLPSSWPCIGRGRFLSKLPPVLSQPFGLDYTAKLAYLSDDRKRNDVLEIPQDNLDDTASHLQNLYDATRAPDLRNGLAAVDFRTQLAEEFLFMTDRFSMAHSVEARVPFLDHLLVEQAFRIPSSIRTRGNDLKYLFKRAIGDLIPSDLLTAPKRGFVIPLELWLRQELRPLAERLLHPERLRRQGLFRPKFYDRFVLPHLQGQAIFTYQVWAALMFQIWHIIFIEQGSLDRPVCDWQSLG